MKQQTKMKEKKKKVEGRKERKMKGQLNIFLKN